MVTPMRLMGKRQAAAGGIGLGVLLLVVTSPVPVLGVENRPSMEALRERVQLYWTFRAEPDWGKIYDQIFDPRAKVKVSKGSFTNQKTSHITILSHEIADIRVEGLEARVTTRYQFRMAVPAGGKMQRTEGSDQVTVRWVFVAGQWYLKYVDPAILPD